MYTNYKIGSKLLAGSVASALALLLVLAAPAAAQPEPSEAVSGGPEGLDETDFFIESKVPARWDIITAPIPRAEISNATGILPLGTAGDPITAESEILAAGVRTEFNQNGTIEEFTGICEYIATEDVSQTHVLFECSHRDESVPSFPSTLTFFHRPWDGTLDAAGNPVLGDEVVALTVDLDAQGMPGDPVFDPPVPPEPPGPLAIEVDRARCRVARGRLLVRGTATGATLPAALLTTSNGEVFDSAITADGAFTFRTTNADCSGGAMTVSVTVDGVTSDPFGVRLR